MSNLLLGVDVGSAHIKAVELKEKKEGYIVKNIMIAPTPPNAVTEGAVIDHSAVASAIRSSVTKVKGVTKDVSVALKGDDVVVKRLKLPWDGKGNFKEQFLWSAEQYIGMTSEDASFDVQLLNFDMEHQIADAVLAAASKDKVADLLTAVSNGGLSPLVVDIESLALVNLVTLFKGVQKHPNAIIDIGYSSVRIIFYEQGHVDTVKVLYKGGKFLAEDMASDMEIDSEKAETMICNREVMTNDADAQAAVTAYGSNLGAEIETAIDIYMQEKGKEPVDIYVCGALAYVAGVLDRIESSMGMTIAHIDPFKYIEIPENIRPVADEAGPAAFALSAALAMRRA